MLRGELLAVGIKINEIRANETNGKPILIKGSEVARSVNRVYVFIHSHKSPFLIFFRNGKFWVKKYICNILTSPKCSVFLSHEKPTRCYVITNREYLYIFSRV